MTTRLTREQIEEMKLLTPVQVKGRVQSMGLDLWKAAGCKGTEELATGVGKTRIGVLACAEELEKNPEAVVYVCVPTQTLRDVDWPDEFRLWGYEHLIEKVNFVCHSSMEKVAVHQGEIDLLVFDEVHNATPINTMMLVVHKVWKVLGLTATLPNPDGYESDKDKRALIDQFAPSIFKITLEEAIELKLVSDFKVTVMKFDLDDTESYVPSGTKARPFKTTELRHYKHLSKMVQRMAYKNPEAKFVWIQKRMAFLFTLRQKELLAQEVMEAIMKEEGKALRTLIFCGSIEQAERLCSPYVYHSQVLAPKDQYLSLFQKQEIPYLGVVQALNEGKNIEQLDQILVIQLNSKELDIIQRIGRSIRFREGHVARVVILVAKDTVDEKWYQSAFENFDKSRIKEYHVRPTRKPAMAPQPGVRTGA